MQEVSELKLKQKKRQPLSFYFLIAVMALLFSPFTGINSMIGMVGDTAIQIKIGLDDIAARKLITEEIYSWHQGLVFTAHESGWYLLLGVMYKVLKLWGVILVGVFFVYATGYTAVKYTFGKAHPFVIAAVLAATPWLNGFPDYNVRPAVTSVFAMTLLIVTCVEDRKPLLKASVFAFLCFSLGWLQGGILPLFLAVYVLFIVIALIFKNYNEVKIMAVGAVAGFVFSLLNPMGIRNYTFGLKQSGATDIWANVDEWNPMHFSMLQIVLILLVFIGFMTNDNLRRFDRKAITRIALLCMFFIMTCVYKRFVVYYSVAFMLFAPEQYESLLKWFISTVIKPKKKVVLSLSNAFYGILTAVCIVFIIGLGAFNVPRYLPTGTMADIERMAAYDHGAVDFIRQKGYSSVFNSFDTGSWLAFNGIKVHIDNRIDPYMSEFSGVDHIRGQMNVTTLADLDAFRSRYDNDAFLINTSSGYSHIIYEIETYASDRYEVVYDNTVGSSIPGVGDTRWIIIECN